MELLKVDPRYCIPLQLFQMEQWMDDPQFVMALEALSTYDIAPCKDFPWGIEFTVAVADDTPDLHAQVLQWVQSLASMILQGSHDGPRYGPLLGGWPPFDGVASGLVMPCENWEMSVDTASG